MRSGYRGHRVTRARAKVAKARKDRTMDNNRGGSGKHRAPGLGHRGNDSSGGVARSPSRTSRDSSGPRSRVGYPAQMWTLWCPSQQTGQRRHRFHGGPTFLRPSQSTTMCRASRRLHHRLQLPHLPRPRLRLRPIGFRRCCPSGAIQRFLYQACKTVATSSCSVPSTA